MTAAFGGPMRENEVVLLARTPNSTCAQSAEKLAIAVGPMDVSPTPSER